MIKQKIQIQPTQENPLIVENYPYGFKRTKKRYWVETNKKKGQRLYEQTLNPKTNIWNKPKKSTYSDIIILYKDEKDYIKSYNFSFTYSDEEDLKKFEENFNQNDLNDYQKEGFKVFRAILKTRKHITHSFHPQTLRTEEEEKKHEEKQKEVKKDINKIFNHYVKKELKK